MSIDEPVVTDYPHDRLTRLAAAMGDALAAQPGTGDVRAMVLLNDADEGCVHAAGYPGDETARHALMMADAVEHIQALGMAVGARVGITINGVPMPGSRK